VLKVQSEAVPIEIESILKRKGTGQKKENNVVMQKPSDYAGCTSEQTIDLRKKFKIKIPDAIVAATALDYNLTLTRYVVDFKNIPVWIY